jgi:hypothetical protein
MEAEGRVRAIAEVECVHRDGSGRIKSVETTDIPVSYVRGADGEPTDIRRE